MSLEIERQKKGYLSFIEQCIHLVLIDVNLHVAIYNILGKITFQSGPKSLCLILLQKNVFGFLKTYNSLFLSIINTLFLINILHTFSVWYCCVFLLSEHWYPYVDILNSTKVIYTILHKRTVEGMHTGMPCLTNLMSKLNSLHSLPLQNPVLQFNSTILCITVSKVVLKFPATINTTVDHNLVWLNSEDPDPS